MGSIPNCGLSYTNVLLRFVDRTHPLHSIMRSAVRQLHNQGHHLEVTPQNCVEFWNVATRPVAKNGFGLTTSDTSHLLRLIERLFPLLPDTPALYPEWRRLVVTFNVAGVQVHDARLVAAMNVHGVSHILTLNPTDFLRYSKIGIVAIDPTAL